MVRSKTIQVSGFLSNVSMEQVKAFLETHTSKGTIYALKIRQQKSGGRAYAVVQITNHSDTELIIRLTNSSTKLYYESSYLLAREMKTDIVPKPRIYSHTMENITLRFGCQVSDEKFCVLWNASGVTVNFGMRMRRLEFLLVHDGLEYKLKLFYENVWQMEMFCPPHRTSK